MKSRFFLCLILNKRLYTRNEKKKLEVIVLQNIWYYRLKTFLPLPFSPLPLSLFC